MTGATTARLRRTFHYPKDSNSDSQPSALDEQEQETLIATLARDNAARNARFRQLLPFLAALAYLPLLLRARTALFTLLSLTSLFSTAFLLHRLPPTVTGFAPLDAWVRGAEVGHDGVRADFRGLRAGDSLPEMKSPLEKFLPYLNAALAALAALMGWLTIRGPMSLAWVGLENVPAIIFAAVLAAKIIMGSVDPVKELSPLVYRYKGA